MQETIIYLLRHASSKPEEKVPDPEWCLSTQGRRQALELSPRLDQLGIEAIVSSPYRRALETVQEFARAKGMPVQQDKRLREKILSRNMIPDFQEVNRRSWNDFDFALPGCETSKFCQERVLGAVREICVQHPGETVLISSHGNAIGLILNSIDPGFGHSEWSRMRNPDLFRIIDQEGVLLWDRGFRFSCGLVEADSGPGPSDLS